MMRLYDFKELNRTKGFHWFSKDALRFFGSRISNFDPVSGLFITSETYAGSFARRYTVRQANFDTGQVSTVGVFQGWEKITQAKAALKRELKKRNA